MSIRTAYLQERANADAGSMETFSGIIYRHALIMTDVMSPSSGRGPSYLMEQGGRMRDVQKRWTGLFVYVTGNDGQVEYKKTVGRVIGDFNAKLLGVIEGSSRITGPELTELISGLHVCGTSLNDEFNMKTTQKTFQGYVDSLVHLSSVRTPVDHYQASMRCFVHAKLLGAWLDKCM